MVPLNASAKKTAAIFSAAVHLCQSAVRSLMTSSVIEPRTRCWSTIRPRVEDVRGPVGVACAQGLPEVLKQLLKRF